MIDLSPNGKQLFDLIMMIPPALDSARSFLQEGKCTPDDVNSAALQFAEECWEEGIYSWDSIPEWENTFGVYFWVEPKKIPDLHSSHLYEVIALLLEFGLDPNVEIDEINLLDELPHIVNEYISADTLALLFEHGANPSLTLRNGESIFLDLDFDVIFDAHEQRDRSRYDALVHSWLVFLGYGARLKDGSLPLDLMDPKITNHYFDISDFKEHRNYFFGLSYVESRGECWSLHIFDRRTMWEVARL